MNSTLEMILGKYIGPVVQNAFEAMSVEMLACVIGVCIISFTIVGTNLICPRKW